MKNNRGKKICGSVGIEKETLNKIMQCTNQIQIMVLHCPYVGIQDRHWEEASAGT